MKGILEFELPEDREELDAAADGLKWKLCLGAITEQVREWRCGKSATLFPRQTEQEPVPVLEAVLDLIGQKLIEYELEL